MVPFAPDTPTQTQVQQAKLLGLLSTPSPGPNSPISGMTLSLAQLLLGDHPFCFPAGQLQQNCPKGGRARSEGEVCSWVEKWPCEGRAGLSAAIFSKHGENVPC